MPSSGRVVARVVASNVVAAAKRAIARPVGNSMRSRWSQAVLSTCRCRSTRSTPARHPRLRDDREADRLIRSRRARLVEARGNVEDARHDQALDARRVPVPLDPRRCEHGAGVADDRVEVVGVTAVATILDGREAGEPPIPESHVERAVLGRADAHAVPSDVAAAVLLVGSGGAGRQPVAPPPEGGDVAGHELDVDGRALGQHPHPVRAVGHDHARGRAIDDETVVRQRRERERVHVETCLPDLIEREPVELEPDHVGARVGRGIEHGDVELAGPRHPSLDAETGQPFEQARRRRAGKLLGLVVAAPPSARARGPVSSRRSSRAPGSAAAPATPAGAKAARRDNPAGHRARPTAPPIPRAPPPPRGSSASTRAAPTRCPAGGWRRARPPAHP